MTLLAAFQTLLARTTSTSDIVVGCPVAGRDDPSLEAVIGPFINTLPFRAELDCSTWFRTLLGQTRTRMLEVLAHSKVPFERLVEELTHERARTQPALPGFFHLRNLPESETQYAGLLASPFVVDPVARRLTSRSNCAKHVMA